jgi:hypothetical protein
MVREVKGRCRGDRRGNRPLDRRARIIIYYSPQGEEHTVMLELVSYALLGGFLLATSLVLWWFVGRAE